MDYDLDIPKGRKLALEDRRPKHDINRVTSANFQEGAVLPLAVPNLFHTLNLAGTTKSNIRSVLSVSLEALPEPLDIMVTVDGCLELRISELVALKWEDVDPKVRTILIERRFTHRKLGKTKTDASEAKLPVAKDLLKVLDDWKPKTNGSEWVFPSNRTGCVRSSTMLLQKGIQPVAKEIGLGHMLRHACRSWLDSVSTPTGFQKDLPRVADISTAMNIYGHALTEDMRKSHNKLVKQHIPSGLLTAR